MGVIVSEHKNYQKTGIPMVVNYSVNFINSDQFIGW